MVTSVISDQLVAVASAQTHCVIMGLRLQKFFGTQTHEIIFKAYSLVKENPSNANLRAAWQIKMVNVKKS